MSNPRTRVNTPLIIAVVAGLLAIGGIYLLTGDDKPAAARKDCVPLEMSTSTEKDELIGRMAERYNAAGREFGGGKCARVTVHGLTSGTAMAALRTGWAGAETGLPEPQVWSPSTSLWLSRIPATRRLEVVATGTHRSIMSSPLVVAMPEEMAAVFLAKHPDPGWDDLLALATAPGGWASLGKPEWGKFSLGRDHPELSSSGLGASIATFHAGSIANNYPGITPKSLADGEVVKFVHGVESSVERYSKDAAEFVDTLLAEDKKNLPVPFVSAIVMQEQLAYTYNRGGPNRKFKTITPTDGTLQFDHPFVVLASATPDQRAAADDFYAYLSEGDRQLGFREAGFRDWANPSAPTEQLRTTLSIPNGQLVSAIPAPAPDLVEAIVKAWNGTRRDARVLLVLDVSGSMNEPAAENDPQVRGSKLDLVKPAAKRALDLLSADDEVGLWTFSSPGYTEHVPVGRLGDNKAALGAAIDGLTATGATDLYATVGAAYTKMAAQPDPERINAIVVLSDGADSTKVAGAREALLAKINPELTETKMPIFTISYGQKSDLETMGMIAATSKALSYDAVKDPKNIDEVFVSVFHNF
ncbi:Ca-activated chloride channel family protein [Actinokineospora alba]|uniref:Ca-activated chloride channel family protein n=1 Tax=Actinokineospora alba TaxID=504798 RepID=A0A1H0WDI7_9PSEU|nr:substrate-binding domain-containing protein [Actinokineospora alba]TDP68878.1 Ca-activated chloride channel family protein [Actinokineospora alba]SDI74097.1 Ca-activated chloride channel family protein [Actinokineospora alba]SDP88810.1 Ca-activated chloride channel family protein [Actinokineospora alba]